MRLWGAALTLARAQGEVEDITEADIICKALSPSFPALRSSPRARPSDGRV